MPNPMMQMLNSNRNATNQNNPFAMISEFKKFAKGMTPQQAEQEVKRMLADGRMSQGQFQQLQEQAKQFMQFLK